MVKYVVAILALLALSASSIAQRTQCPGSNQSWAFTLPPPMQWGVFDLTVPAGLQPNPLTNIPTGLLSVIYQNHTAETFIGVPQTVATAFQNAGTQQINQTRPGTNAAQIQAQNQRDFFYRQIKPVYHELLLISGSNCPLNTTGTQALWTK